MIPCHGQQLFGFCGRGMQQIGVVCLEILIFFITFELSSDANMLRHGVNLSGIWHLTD